jgi:hypothetical protein
LGAFIRIVVISEDICMGLIHRLIIT